MFDCAPLFDDNGPINDHTKTKVLQNTDDVSGENYNLYPEDIQDLLDSEWGFKRRERDDVKKPGPRLDAKTLKILYHNRSVTG